MKWCSRSGAVASAAASGAATALETAAEDTGVSSNSFRKNVHSAAYAALLLEASSARICSSSCCRSNGNSRVSRTALPTCCCVCAEPEGLVTIPSTQWATSASGELLLLLFLLLTWPQALPQFAPSPYRGPALSLMLLVDLRKVHVVTC